MIGGFAKSIFGGRNMAGIGSMGEAVGKLSSDFDQHNRYLLFSVNVVLISADLSSKNF